MRITEELEKLKEVMEVDKEMLVHIIYESFVRISRDEGTEADRFIVGLRYPEFLAGQTNDENEILGAYRRAEIYRKRLGVEFDYLRYNLESIYNLK